MAITNISSERSLLSYARVQRFISSIIRNKRILFTRKASTAERLNIGCGMFPVPELVNLDWHWCPGVDVCCDLRRPLPFPNDRFEGIYTEHCIDGLPPRYFMPNLREMYRVLKPGGTLRIIFCDAEFYIDAYVANRDKGIPMPFAKERGTTTRMHALDLMFHHWTHKTLVDFDSLSIKLRECGFKDIQRTAYLQGRDARLLHDQESRRGESLYVEAVK